MHHGNPVVWYRFEYNTTAIEAVKQLPGTRWSASQKSWYQQLALFRLEEALEKLQKLGTVDYSVCKQATHTNNRSTQQSHKTSIVKYPHREKTVLPIGFLEKLAQKRYSKNTIKTYTAYFKDFQHHFKDLYVQLTERALSMLRLYYKEKNQVFGYLKERQASLIVPPVFLM